MSDELMMEEAEEPKGGLELVWMDPYSLSENPLNPRTHPQAQRRALHQALDSLGWLKPLIYNIVTKRLVDGHLRRQEAIESGITEVPVICVRLTEEQERKALASLDYITNMAVVDERQYAELLKDLEESDSELYAALMGEKTEDDDFMSMEDDAEETSDVHLIPGEQYNYVMLIFRNELDWLSAIEHFEINQPAQDLLHKSKVVGRTRVVDGAAYLERMLAEEEIRLGSATDPELPEDSVQDNHSEQESS